VVAGIATFSGLSINTAGTGYTLTASSTPTYTSATSGAFNITPQPTSFTISVNNAPSATITAGSSATLSETGLPPSATGTVSFSSNGVGLCSISLSGLANESTSCSTSSALPVGSYVATAAFSDTNGKFLDSTSSNSVAFAVSPPVVTPPSNGYWLVGSDGGIFTFGSAQFYGSTGNLRLNRPVVGITPTADRGGYWLVASDGGVFSFGDTQFYGSIPGLGINPAGSGLPHSLNAPIVGMVPSVDDHGYFMVASDGGVFAFGDAHFEGSCPEIGGCAGKAVAVMPDASGNGYWLVTNRGDVYTFGDAQYLGAPGTTGAPIVSAVRTPNGGGYWILDAAGNVYGYGDAANLGSAAGDANGNTASAIFTDAAGNGYGVTAQNGAVVTFGGMPNYGGMNGTKLNGSIIAASGY